MKRVLILTTKKSLSRDEKTFYDFLSPDEKEGYETSVFCLEDLLFYLESNPAHNSIQAGKDDIDSFDLVWLKRSAGDTAFYAQVCAMYLQNRGTKFITKDVLVNSSAEYNKLKEHVFFSLSGLSFPNTRLINQHNGEHFFRYTELTYPVVVKSIFGSRGNDNFLIHTEEQLRDLIEHYPKAYLVQEYIKSVVAYRVLVFGNEAEVFIQKIHNDAETHINSVAHGADSKIIQRHEAPPVVIQLSESVARIMNREITGVDIILEEDTNTAYVLEANRPPSLENGALAEVKGRALATYIKKILGD